VTTIRPTCIQGLAPVRTIGYAPRLLAQWDILPAFEVLPVREDDPWGMQEG
jgi:hypothetical protein